MLPRRCDIVNLLDFSVNLRWRSTRHGEATKSWCAAKISLFCRGLTAMTPSSKAQVARPSLEAKGRDPLPWIGYGYGTGSEYSIKAAELLMVGPWKRAASVSLRPVTCSIPAISSIAASETLSDLKEKRNCHAADLLDAGDVVPDRRCAKSGERCSRRANGPALVKKLGAESADRTGVLRLVTRQGRGGSPALWI
jgi:hypothetical protein